jgi:hypothetical protein
MIVTTVVFLGVIMLTFLVGVAVIPGFDRRPQPSEAPAPRDGPGGSRS